MYNLTKQGDTTVCGILEYCCDTAADIANLPTNVPMGSTCIVIADSSIYMINIAAVNGKS